MAHIDDWRVDRIFNGWTLTDESPADTELSLVKIGEARRHHVIEKIDASYSDVLVSGLLTVKFGKKVITKKYIHGAGALDFPGFGLKTMNANEPVVVVLAAGTGGATAVLTVAGYTSCP